MNWAMQEFRHVKRLVLGSIVVENKKALCCDKGVHAWFICDDHMGIFTLYLDRDETGPQKPMMRGTLFECIEYVERGALRAVLDVVNS